MQSAATRRAPSWDGAGELGGQYRGVSAAYSRAVIDEAPRACAVFGRHLTNWAAPRALVRTARYAGSPGLESCAEQLGCQASGSNSKLPSSAHAARPMPRAGAPSAPGLGGSAARPRRQHEATRAAEPRGWHAAAEPRHETVGPDTDEDRERRLSIPGNCRSRGRIHLPRRSLKHPSLRMGGRGPAGRRPVSTQS